MFIYPLSKYGFKENSSLGTMLGAGSRAVSKIGLNTLPGLLEFRLVMDDQNNDKNEC